MDPVRRDLEYLESTFGDRTSWGRRCATPRLYHNGDTALPAFSPLSVSLIVPDVRERQQGVSMNNALICNELHEARTGGSPAYSDSGRPYSLPAPDSIATHGQKKINPPLTASALADEPNLLV